MPTDIAQVLGGPAIIAFDGAVIYTEGDITTRTRKELKARPTSPFGKIDDTLLDCITEISFKPVQWKNLDKLLPYLASSIGTRIFGNTDKPIVITSIPEARTYTWSRGAVSAMPNLGLGVEKDLLGDMTLTALKANAALLSGANSVVALGTTPFADATFDPTKLYDIPFKVTLGALFEDIDTEAGVDISWNLSLEPVKGDLEGTIDMRLTDLTAEAKFIPFGISAADLLAAAKVQGTGVRRGVKMSTLGNDLVVSGYEVGDPVVTLSQCFISESGERHGASVNLPGELSLMTTRKFVTGAMQPLATIGSVAA